MKKFTATPDQIKKWKLKHGKVTEIICCLNSDEEIAEMIPSDAEDREEKIAKKKKSLMVSCFLKDPYVNINVIGRAMAKSDDPMARNLSILDNLMIEGDPAFKAIDGDNRVRVMAGIQAYGIVDTVDSEVKKH